MERRGLLFLLLSVIGGMVGASMASLISFWLYPQLQYDFSMFLYDLFSLGRVASAIFVWLFYVPALIVLLLLSRRFIKTDLKNWPYTVFLSVSFLLVFISQMHLFAAFASGLLGYFLNTVLAGLILIGIMVARRCCYRDQAP